MKSDNELIGKAIAILREGEKQLVASETREAVTRTWWSSAAATAADQESQVMGAMNLAKAVVNVAGVSINAEAIAVAIANAEELTRALVAKPPPSATNDSCKIRYETVMNTADLRKKLAGSLARLRDQLDRYATLGEASLLGQERSLASRRKKRDDEHAEWQRRADEIYHEKEDAERPRLNKSDVAASLAAKYPDCGLSAETIEKKFHAPSRRFGASRP